VDGVGVETAGERLGGFTKAGVNSAEPGWVEEDAGTVDLMIDSGTAAMGHKERSIGWNAVRLRPALCFDARTFFGRDGDQVLAAAPAAIVAGPVLQSWEEQAWSRHEKTRRSKKALTVVPARA
jgi:hypothetical protein